MRRTIALTLFAMAVAGLACRGERNLRPADVQIYDLPPADASWTMNPPEYSKTDGLMRPSQGKDKQNPRGLGGAGGAAPGGMNAGFN